MMRDQRPLRGENRKREKSKLEKVIQCLGALAIESANILATEKRQQNNPTSRFMLLQFPLENEKQEQLKGCSNGENTCAICK